MLRKIVVNYTASESQWINAALCLLKLFLLLRAQHRPCPPRQDQPLSQGSPSGGDRVSTF